MDINDPIDNDKDAEVVIKKAQESFGYIMPEDLGEGQGQHNAFARLAKEKMMGFGLIRKDPNKEMYYLTDKGWMFESFKAERILYNRERFVKHHAYWKAKLWLLIAIASFGLGILTKILTELL